MTRCSKLFENKILSNILKFVYDEIEPKINVNNFKLNFITLNYNEIEPKNYSNSIFKSEYC